jgi:hypothetical protein
MIPFRKKLYLCAKMFVGVLEECNAMIWGALLTMAVGWAIKNSSNLIGGRQKFTRSTFTLESNSLQNTYMAILFWEFWCQEFVRFRKTCPQYLWKPKISLSGQTFLSKLIQSLQFVYLNGFLPCPLEESLSKDLLT